MKSFFGTVSRYQIQGLFIMKNTFIMKAVHTCRSQFLNTFKNSETLIAYNLETTQAIFKIQKLAYSEFDAVFTGRIIYICPYTFQKH